MNDVPARLVREALREHAATPPSSACLEAETLAAWSDGALGARDRAAAESHVAACARCQAMLSAMTRIAPPPPKRRWFRTPTFKWLVPLAAAAAAVGLWIAVPRPRPDRQATGARASVPAPSATATRSDSRGPDASNTQPAVDRLVAPAAGAGQRQEKAGARGALSAAAAARAPSRGAQLLVTGETALRDTRTPAPQLPPSTPIGVDAFAVPAAPAPPPAPSQPPATPQTSADAGAAVPPLEETIAVAPNVTESVRVRGDRAAAAAPAQALAKTSAPLPDIVSPDRNVRWRVRTAGLVERSIDGGTTWQTQSTGVRTPLVSGAAPAPTICWLVGSGGTVLRSVDGATWKRVPFPETIDLTSVLASDAATATILAGDGRTFTTRDGGKTWTPTRHHN